MLLGMILSHLQNHAPILRGMLDGECCDQQRLHHATPVHVTDAPSLISIPALTLHSACAFLISLTISIGFNPEFLARVYGITSRASAYACKQCESSPVVVSNNSYGRNDASVSAELTPAMRCRFFTSNLTTHWALLIKRFASAMKRSFDAIKRAIVILPKFSTPTNLMHTELLGREGDEFDDGKVSPSLQSELVVSVAKDSLLCEDE